MKRLTLQMALGFVTAAFVGAATAGEIDPGLETILRTTAADQPVSVLVFLKEQTDTERITAQMNRERATLRARHETVVRSLQATAQATQTELIRDLEADLARGAVLDFRPYHISNMIRVDATVETIRRIAARPDVLRVYYNYEIELDAPVGKVSDDRERDEGRTPTVGLVAVRAPEVWDLGFTGEGVLIATLDTGVDGNHPALASRWRGVADPRYQGHPEWAWFDPVTNTTFPQSFGSHGTHTMGSVCGGAPGEQVGVAPGVQWIHAAVIDRVSIPQTVADALAAFEWLLDPDEDPVTNWDVPAVCSNSWRVRTSHGYPPCDETFWNALDACGAAGIVILFSAGNEGPSAETVGRPPDRATDEYRTCAIGAVDANNPSWPVASFSSRGPSYCTPTGEAAIKPELAAPGVAVYSSVPGGGYQSSGWDGTSMASPHVNGVVALMREACPDLSVEEILQVLYDTAHDLGPAGNDNDYGFGMVDAYEAVTEALAMCSGPPRARDSYHETPVNTPIQIGLLATDYDGLPDPPGALTYIITSLPTTGNTLTDVGNGHVITAGELPYSLVNYGAQVLFSPAGAYYGTDTFQFKANDGGVPPEGGDSNLATVSVLVRFDPPVITTEALPPALVDYPYAPFQIEVSGGQPALTWEVLGGQYIEENLGVNQFQVVGTARGWHDDDEAWQYTLPFSFPFYDAEYTSCYVCSNGFINFGSSSEDYQNSDSSLIAATRIAPCWDDLRTDGTGEDIFIDGSVAGQVTIRWAARTWSGSYPVNVSLTLYEDGSIRFHYGSGNTNLSPTIGISAGNGTDYVLASYNNQGTLTNANSLEFYMPSLLPDGMVLSPSGILSGTPTEVGLFSPIFKVTDSLNRSDQREIPLEVQDHPYPPFAHDMNVSTAVSMPFSFELLVTDDGLPDPPAALTRTVLSLPTHGDLFDAGDGQITTVPHTLVGGGDTVQYHPTPGYAGPDAFDFMANDGGTPPYGGDSNVGTVMVTMGGPAWDPVAYNVSAATPVSIAVNVLLNASDPNGDPLTFIIENLPTQGSLSDPNGGPISSVPYTLAAAGNVVTYQPPAGQHLVDTFGFSARDASAGSNVATATVTVGGPLFDPVAYGQNVVTTPSTPIDITLQATDPNGDPLSFVIETLPVSGTGLIEDPNAGIIWSAPYTLVGGGHVVRFLPPYGQIITASFQFSAWDATAGSNLATVSVTVGQGVPQAAYTFNMDTNPGWTTEGAWAYGQPIGGGTHNRDPLIGHTGTRVYGYNLYGDYANNMPPYYLTAQIDCRHMSDVELRFWRWLGVEGAQFDHADVQVSNDGANWTPVWVHSGSVIADTAWTQMIFDIHAVADNQQTVYIRWGMGPTDGGVTYPGWNIDDVEIWAIVGFTCEGTLLGDVNLDETVDGLDIQAFLAVLFSPYDPAVTMEEFCAADVDEDGFVTIHDVDGFVEVLLNP